MTPRTTRTSGSQWEWESSMAETPKKDGFWKRLGKGVIEFVAHVAMTYGKQ